MDKKRPREAAARAAKAATASVGTYWIAATAAIVLVLVGVVTAIVTTKPTPALIGALILLAVLSAVLAAMQQHSTQSQPASGLGIFDPSAENPYGAPFFARQAFRLSTVP